jgi:CubicO group peptidase (beta-lactamase class C family)
MARLPTAPFAEWQTPHATAVVVGRDGVLDQAGDTSRPFRLASVAKLLAAYATLVAVEEGSLGLDDPAGPPGATVRHLLAHTAGYGFDGAEPIAPPAQRRIYSNTGVEVLADHVAARTGLSFGTYLAEAVLRPLGMDATELRGSPAHGIRSTGADLARFAAELLAPKVLAPATLAEATTVQFPGLSGVLPGIGRQEPCDWGLGFELKDAKAPHWTGHTNSPATFGHFGGAGTFLWVDPHVKLALVCLTDREFGAWALAAWPALADAVLTEGAP